MIEYRKGNLLDVTEGVIVHGCNMQSVMGSGVAKAIRDKYPQCYDRYKRALSIGDYYKKGDVVWYIHNHDLHIANGLTQTNYGRAKGVRYVDYAAVRQVFQKVIHSNRHYGSIIYFPKIGAGLGGGDWNIIEQIINDCDPHDEFKKICITLD